MKKAVKTISLIILIAGMPLFIITCKHEVPLPDGIEVNASPTTSNIYSPDTVYFQNTVQPLLISNCSMSGCHDAITHASDVELTSYSKIIVTGKVYPGSPASSKLYKVLNETGEEMMPPNGNFTSAQKDIVYKWILQGAKNNSYNACDTAIFTYSGAVSPLMNTYCKGCHNPASLGGGIDLSTYSTVKIQTLNGKLIGSITHASGFSPMPTGGSKLSACQIIQVKKWIAAGTLNN